MKFGNVLARAGKPEKALAQYESAFRCNPLSFSAYHNAASVCQRLNRFEEAIALRFWLDLPVGLETTGRCVGTPI